MHQQQSLKWREVCITSHTWSKGQAMQHTRGVYEPYGLQTSLSKKKQYQMRFKTNPIAKKKQSPCFLSILVLDEEELIKLDLEV